MMNQNNNFFILFLFLVKLEFMGWKALSAWAVLCYKGYIFIGQEVVSKFYFQQALSYLSPNFIFILNCCSSLVFFPSLS